MNHSRIFWIIFTLIIIVSVAPASGTAKVKRTSQNDHMVEIVEKRILKAEEMVSILCDEFQRHSDEWGTRMPNFCPGPEPIPEVLQVEITEIMYNPEGADAGREWIEIANTGNVAVDLTGWTLFENNTNHALTSVQGGLFLATGTRAVIADSDTSFLADYPDYSGILFDSAFSLSNTGETLELRNEELEAVDTVPYVSDPGADNNGNSLEKVAEGWLANSPTPGN